MFYCTVLSRLAYFTSENFIQSYLEIFGPIIPETLMRSIDKAKFDNTIFKSSIYNLNQNSNVPIYMNGKKIKIDFTAMADRINGVVLEAVNSTIPRMFMKSTNQVAYISISTSNYSGYYILVDKRMPNSIFVVFRGTYSSPPGYF